MNRRVILYVVGRIMVVTAVLMIPSLIVALIYREGWVGVYPFLATMAGTAFVGWGLSFRRPEDMTYYMKEGFVIVALTWIILSLSGRCPLSSVGGFQSFTMLCLRQRVGFQRQELRF